MITEALQTRVDFHTRERKVNIEMPLDGAPGWRLGLLVLVHEGALVVAEVKVFPGGDRLHPLQPGRGGYTRTPWIVTRMWSEEEGALEGTQMPTITTRMLRSIRLGEIVSTIRKELERQRLHPLERDVWEEALGIAPGPSTLGEAFAEVLSHSPSRSRQKEEFLARLAQRYVALVATPSKHPRADLAVELGMSPSQVRDAIFRARAKGYLTRSNGPRAGGSLTQAARNVLQRTSQPPREVPTKRPTRGATAPSPFVQTDETSTAMEGCRS